MCSLLVHAYLCKDLSKCSLLKVWHRTVWYKFIQYSADPAATFIRVGQYLPFHLTPTRLHCVLSNYKSILWVYRPVEIENKYIKRFNPLKTKRRPLYLKPQSVPRCTHFHLGCKNQSVYAVSGTSRCLFSDKYKTHKYSVGRAYSSWMLNWWCIT